MKLLQLRLGKSPGGLQPWRTCTHITSFASQHPVYITTQVKVLNGSSYAWLGEVLVAFNRGNLHAYDQLCEKHAAALNSQPALVENERALREKITILALTELIFK